MNIVVFALLLIKESFALEKSNDDQCDGGFYRNVLNINFPSI